MAQVDKLLKERCLSIRICIKLHSPASSSHRKVWDLMVRMTDDNDPYFLYNLVISEEDFQSLNIQQSLLVDFSAFPQKFIDLLCQCIQEENKEVPRFLLQLSSSASVLGGSPSQLDVIVETILSKHLTHLSLRFLPATNMEVKRYLANCLKYLLEKRFKAKPTIRELRAKCQGLEEKSQRSQQKVVSLQRDNSALDAECHEKEKEVNRLNTRVAVLEQELKDKEQLLSRSNEVLKASQEQKVSLDAGSEKKQIKIGKLEATIKSLSAELLKANDIIKNLQGDLKSMMGKLKLKNAVTVQQSDHEKKMQEEQKEPQGTKKSLQMQEEEKQKLNESKDLLKTNENVINWLNKKHNENHCVGTNSSSATVSTHHVPENRTAFHASRMNCHLPSSYQVRPYVTTAPASHPSSTESRNSVPRVQYNSFPKALTETHSGTSRPAPCSKKENWEAACLDLKYLKKREVGYPLQGLNQNLGPGKAT
uniref:Spindle assembly abnormal protein 6 N-terminal domain-containing protein n=1 Tax=Leptobrachium leishanense TaxID=445787 RepID=A0A8C5MPP2_9ANUR